MSAEYCVSRYFDEDANTIDGTVNITVSSNTSDLSKISIESETDIFSLSQLNIEDPDPIPVQAFFNITPRQMPQSPHYIIEEEFYSNPWAILIATIFLTKTSAKNARPHMKSFFEEYPTPYHVLEDAPISIERFFDKLGLKKRGHMIWKLSYQFVSSKWLRASDLCGIGKYGEDAYRIFCLGHLDVDPHDRYLKLYVDWLRKHTDFMEDESIIDSELVMEDPVMKYYRITLRHDVSVT